MVFDELRSSPEVLYGAVIAFAIVVLLTPAVGGMARLLGAVDRPDARRINRRPIPRLGGLAIFLGILVPALAFLDLSGESRGVLLGAAIATVVGAVDDFRGLSPTVKLLGQVVAASIPCAFGVWIDHVTFPFVGVLDIPAWIGMPLSVVFIVAVMNMVNFLDGLDGLAAGVCGIAGVTYAILALSLGKPDPAILSAIVAGACLGFLRHNFFPARIFMGDSGALCLGFILAAVSIQGLLKTGVDGRPRAPAARPRGADHGHVVRRRTAPEALAAHLHGRPEPLPPPVPEHRLLATQGRGHDVAVVREPRRSGARDPVRPLPGGRELASVGDARRRRDRTLRGRLLRLRRVPARDRQAREPASASTGPRAGGLPRAHLRVVSESFVIAGSTEQAL